jgi:catechol 2,3-dioxygenase-like lactoylglutathione lyase family enzyme
MITGLAHVCFTVRDLDRSISFYVDLLGMRHGFDFVNEQGRRFGVYLHVGGRNFIELFEGEPPREHAGGSFQHICLEVDDIEDTVRVFRDAGVEVGDVSLGSDQSCQAWLRDPDGNRIELHQYTDDSRQAPLLAP